jgi:formyltetrahydrofolate-dependent phosphoribosylglycinamide formyltransferase
MSTPAKLAVLISDNGSKLQTLIDAIRMRALDAQIVVVVADQEAAPGLQRAEKAGIPTRYHLPEQYRDADLAQLLREYKPDWVVLAGWMHMFSDAFFGHFPYRIVNLHPALPGQFPGAHATEEAWAAFQRGEIKKTGVTVRLVADEQVNSGPVIASEDVPIYPTDTLETLTQRIHQTEHGLLVNALRRLIEGD